MTITPRHFRIAAQSLGLLLLTAGTAAVDWRAAAILLGSILFAAGVHASFAAMRPPTN